MEYGEVDEMIRYLEYNIPKTSSVLFAVEMHDWRPLIAKAKEIQEAFNSGVRYPSKSAREQAWVRFNDLRTLLFERANKERSRFRQESETFRNDILRHVKHAGYSRLTDALFFFSPTTVEDMKGASRVLKEGGEMLSRHKGRMLKEHKDECFARFQELRAEQDVFWGEYHKQYAVKQAEHRTRMGDAADRVRGNIRSNREKLAKAQSALERTQANLEANLARLSGARGSDYAERVSGWISDDREKLRSISDSISRIEEWIREDQTRLDDILRRS